MSQIDVLAAMDSASINLFEVGRHADARKIDEARAAIAELINAVEPVAASLASRIDAGNSMTPQAVMVRQLISAMSHVRGSK